MQNQQSTKQTSEESVGEIEEKKIGIRVKVAQVKGERIEEQLNKTIQSIIESKLGKDREVKECILDPSMFPFLADLEQTDLETIWIVDTFFKSEPDPKKLEKLIRRWTTREVNVNNLMSIFNAGKVGKAQIKFITERNTDREILDYIKSKIQQTKVKDKGVIGDAVGKMIGFAKETGNIIVSKGKKLPYYAKKAGMYVIDTSNKFIDRKEDFFNKLTGGKTKKSRGLRLIGGTILSFAIGTLFPPAGIALELGLLTVDP